MLKGQTRTHVGKGIFGIAHLLRGMIEVQRNPVRRLRVGYINKRGDATGGKSSVETRSLVGADIADILEVRMRAVYRPQCGTRHDNGRCRQMSRSHQRLHRAGRACRGTAYQGAARCQRTHPRGTLRRQRRIRRQQRTVQICDIKCTFVHTQILGKDTPFLPYAANVRRQ